MHRHPRVCVAMMTPSAGYWAFQDFLETQVYRPFDELGLREQLIVCKLYFTRWNSEDYVFCTPSTCENFVVYTDYGDVSRIREEHKNFLPPLQSKIKELIRESEVESESAFISAEVHKLFFTFVNEVHILRTDERGGSRIKVFRNYLCGIVASFWDVIGRRFLAENRADYVFARKCLRAWSPVTPGLTLPADIIEIIMRATSPGKVQYDMAQVEYGMALSHHFGM